MTYMSILQPLFCRKKLYMHDPSILLQQLGIEGSIPRLDEALTHASYANEHPQAVDYERLEFLGDAVLGLCVAELLLQEAPTASEGTMSRIRSSLVSTVALASFARSIGLERWVILGNGAVSSGDVLQPKVLADVVEAIVAAVFLERGLEGARIVTSRIVGDSLKGSSCISRISQPDPKSALQERVQNSIHTSPSYRVVSMHGLPPKCLFEVEVFVGSEVLGKGQGRSKKIAEQAAAQAALDVLAHRKELTWNEPTSELAFGSTS